MMTKDGITVECVSCKKRRLLTFRDAAALDDMPFCDCGNVMVVLSVTIDNRKKRST
jgi:hypothetical protein